MNRLSLLAPFLLFATTALVAHAQAASDGTQSAPPSRSLSGVLVDQRGFPVSNAYVFADWSVRKWLRSDVNGRFKLQNIPADKKVAIVWSQRSGAMTIIPIPPAGAADGRYVLDCGEGRLQGRVVDSAGRLVAGARVTLHVSGPRGISYTEEEKTDSQGRVIWWLAPRGPGFAVRATLPTGESTAAIPTVRPVTIRLPDLVQRSPTRVPYAKVAPALVQYSGRVVDEQGRPIAGVHLQVTVSFGGWATGDDTQTGADGRWSIREPEYPQNVEIRLDHSDFVGFHFERRTSPSPQDLRAGTAVQVMKRGLRVAGTVRDSSGKPVGNALVLAGHLYSRMYGEPIEDSTAARTGRDGKFSIGGIPMGSRSLVVEADGFAPAGVSINLSPQTGPLDVVLDNGRTVSGRIVDESGKPIEDADIHVEEWIVPGQWTIPLSRTARTGADGRFSIANVPQQGSVSALVKAAARVLMHFTMKPGAHDAGDVALYAYPVIRGAVVDAQSGKPIKSFTVTAGMLYDAKFIAWQALKTNAEDGQFERTISGFIVQQGESLQLAARITAPGYAPEITAPVEVGKKSDRCVVKLKKARDFAGRALTSDGKPAMGARVFFVGPENNAAINGATIMGYSFAPDLRSTVRPDGAFDLPPTGKEGRILILDEAGYALVPTAGFKNGDSVSLTAWGRIEGTYRPGGHSRPDAAIVLETIRPREDPSSRDRVYFRQTTTADPAGRFVIEHVPAIPLQVGAWLDFGPSAEQIVRVTPGKTLHLKLGEDGPPVSGRVDLADVVAANRPAGNQPFDTSTSWVRAVRIEPRPDAPAGVDAADWQAQLDSVKAGAPRKDLTIPFTFANLQTDRTFTFDSLAPGKYVLIVEIHGKRPPQTCGWGLLLGKADSTFTVGDKAKALVLPTLRPSARSHPGVGSIAAEITGKLVTGEPFSLAELRGKYVVLDFWAGWCQPCLASQPVLKEVYERHKQHVAFVGLNLDYQDASAKQAIELIKSPWPQVLAGPWGYDNRTLMGYGVEVIPSIWVIDREGKVVARDVSAEDLERTLAERLKGR